MSASFGPRANFMALRLRASSRASRAVITVLNTKCSHHSRRKKNILSSDLKPETTFTIGHACFFSAKRDVFSERWAT